MNNWEDKYEEYNSGLLEDKIHKLEELVEKSQANKEQYKELTKYKRISESLYKVGNLLEYKNKLDAYLDKIDTEMSRRKKLTKINNQIEELDSKIEKFEVEYKEVEKQLKKPNLDKEEKEKLENKKQKLLSDRNENSEEYSLKQEELKWHIDDKSEFSKKTDEELNALAINVSSRISKCNIAGKNLLEGKSWDYIEYRLDNFKEPTKYTSRKKIKKELKKSQNPYVIDEGMEKVEPSVKKDINDTDLEQNTEEVEANEKVEPFVKKDINNTDLEQNTEEAEANDKLDITFEQKHPRFAKITNVFRNFKNKIKSLFIRKDANYDWDDYLEDWGNNIDYDEFKNNDKAVKDDEFKNNDKAVKGDEFKEDDKLAKDIIENISEGNRFEEITDKDLRLDKDFRTFLKELADKGMEELSEEEKAQKRQQAQEKLIEMRAANRENEAAKFGQDYASKSDYREQDDGQAR